jgi:hypothetical protein
MDGGLCIVLVKPLCFILQNERIICSEVAQNHKFTWLQIALHFSSLRNCCVAMNECKVEVIICQAMIEWILQLALQWLLIHMSVEIQCFKVMFCVSLSVNTSSNVFSKSVGPGHSLQSWKKQFVWGGLQIIVERQCWYVERWCSLLLVSSDILQSSNINFTFWWVVHTHTLCVPLAPAIRMQGCKHSYLH